MIIKFKKIRLYNFLSFGDSTIDLDKEGYTLVQGINENPDDLAKSNGSGKCFGAGTKVLMWDGTTKTVEDIKVNDIIMGWDSTPRIVLETHSGTAPLYEVSASRGQYKFTCNGEHILCLNKTIDRRLSKEALDYWEVSVDDWLKSKDSYKRNYCQFSAPVKQFYTNPLTKLYLDPYFLGLWLGDGTSSEPAVCTIDKEIEDYLYQYAGTFPEIHINESNKQKTDCKSYRFSVGQHTSGSAKNPILEALKYYNLRGNKHIPLEYLTASEEVRLKLLAGLLDTDGSLIKSAKFSKKSLRYNYHYMYEFCQKDNQLAEDIVFLARSLGFKVTKNFKNIAVNNEVATKYVRIHIFGDLGRIPCLLPRKKCTEAFDEDKAICFSLHPAITPIGTGKYYGFQISGDGKFLLDNFLVVHNSSIFDGIVWNLTSTTIRGSKDVVNINGNDGALVDLTFTIDKDEYRVIRTKDHSEYKTNLKIYINGEDKSGKGIRDTSQLLTEYLPDLTAELIGSVIIMGQGLPQKFTGNSPSGRKEILEKLSKSDFMIDDLKDRISKRKTKIQSEIRVCEDEQLKLRTQRNQYELTKEKYTELLNDLSSEVVLQTAIRDTELELAELKKNTDIDALYDEQKDNEKEYYRLNNKITDLYEKEKEELSNEQENYNNSVAEPNQKINELSVRIQTLSNEIRKLDNISDVCPTCGQKLPDVHKIDTTKQKQELELLKAQLESYKDIVRKLTDKFSETKSAISDKYKNSKYKLTEDRDDIFKNKLASIKASIVQYSEHKTNLENSLNQLNTELDGLSARKEMYQNEINSAEKTIEEISEKILYYNNKHDELDLRIGAITKMESAVKRDFRGVLLTNVINYINNKAKDYCKQVFGTDKLDFVLDGNNISISYAGKEYENLSGGEKVRVDIIIQLALRDMLCKFLNFSSNILAIDEIFDALDSIGCENITNLIFKELTDVEGIYIITHRADLPISCDNNIFVKKNEKGISNIC